MDLVFLLDQSESINPPNYDSMKLFTTEIVKSFNISQDFMRVGVAQFSDIFQREFYLNEYNTEALVTQHILALTQRGGGTQIGRALDAIRDYFQESRGSRRSYGVSQNLVLITDGRSDDKVVEAALRLRKLGIEIFVIGIGYVNALELLQITGDQYQERLFLIQDFGSLENIKQKVVDTICESKLIVERGGGFKGAALLAATCRPR